MSFYAHVVFPKLCDWLLSGPVVTKHRRELLTEAAGDVLEIGFGTGLNLPCYPTAVRKLTAVDPNPGMHRLARTRAKEAGVVVDHHVLSCDQLPFADNTFDRVVSTFTLCSIKNVANAMSEVVRTLKLGGKFLFLEHGLCPEPTVQIWQRRLNRLEMLLGDGCHLDRNIHELIAAQSFASIRIQNAYLEKTPRTHGYLYYGCAVK